MNEMDKILMDFLDSPMKTFLTTLSGTILGYVPIGKIAIFASTLQENVDTAFQHTVWTFTILVAITSLVSFIQKQYDRYKLRKNKKGEEND